MRLKDNGDAEQVPGAAQGMGAAACAKFAAGGPTVIGCGLRAERIDPELERHPVDATDRAAVDMMVAAAPQRPGRIAVIEVSGGMSV